MKSEKNFQNHSVWTLQDDRNQVFIAPDRGARILRWTVEGRQVITWPESADWSDWNKIRGGNPILFPFIARHFVDGVNQLWRDDQGKVRPMPQHGFARDLAFTVVDASPAGASPNSLHMRLLASEQTWAFYPYHFQFDVIVSLLSESNLEIRFETTNLDTQALPYYAGNHFYFNISHEDRRNWRLNLPCASWARQNPDGSIRHEESTSELLRLDDESLIDRFQVRPLGSRVTLFQTKANQRLIIELKSSDPKPLPALSSRVPWYAVTTWTQTAQSDFYCVEPWLGLPNAIAHREGLRQLAPGETEIATCILDGRFW